MAREDSLAKLALKTWLIDTGPLVAYLDRTDPAHSTVAKVFGPFTGQFSTTSAVITEAMHFLGDVRDGPMMLAELVRDADVQTFECTRHNQLIVAATMMRKYADTPMDFADATLVLLAGQLKIAEIFTLDRRGFSTYRTPDGGQFRLVL